MDIQKLGHSLALAARWQDRYICHHLAPFELGPRTLPFYLTIAHNEGLSQKNLREKVVTDKTRTTKAVNYLERCGYVHRVTNREDNRKKGVVLTNKGREIFPLVEEKLQQLDNLLSHEIPQEDLKKFMTLLDSFSAAVYQDMEKLQ
jgi:DNA-binding MarR family transcriptional regulator